MDAWEDVTSTPYIHICTSPPCLKSEIFICSSHLQKYMRVGKLYVNKSHIIKPKVVLWQSLGKDSPQCFDFLPAGCTKRVHFLEVLGGDGLHVVPVVSFGARIQVHFVGRVFMQKSDRKKDCS